MPTPLHFADRLLERCRKLGAPVCVGIDPVYERLPDALRRGGDDPASRCRAIETFCLDLVRCLHEHVPAVKPQIACFERYGSAGYAVYEKVVREARGFGLIVITDAKRGDIDVTAEHYAEGLLAGPSATDAVTVNPYLGPDAIEPFIQAASRQGGGIFVLVRTSNPGSDALQRLPMRDGPTVAETIADMVASLGSRPGLVGACGYSLLGAVVGATKVEDFAALRKRMPKQIFLLPGVGAQGAKGQDLRLCFDEQGFGALATASRSVIYAYEQVGGDWQSAVVDAARRLRDEVAAVCA